MKRIARLVALLAAVLGVVLALAPARALAAPYPARSEIYIDGAYLSEGAPSGVTYYDSYGELVLTNYTGGPIQVYAQDYGDRDLTITLVGTNTIYASGSDQRGAAVANVTGDSNILIYSADPNGMLDIKSTYSGSGDFYWGILVGGNITISGTADVRISMDGASRAALICKGIYSSGGAVTVKDSAQLSVGMRVNDAKQCAGIGLSAASNAAFVVSTNRNVYIDLSNCSVMGDSSSAANYPPYTVGIHVNKSIDPLVLSKCPKLTIYATHVYHKVQGNAYGDPNKSGYLLSSGSGSYVYSITESGKTSVFDLNLDWDPSYSEVFWGGPCVSPVSVRDGAIELVLGTDYTITYTPNNIDAGQVLMHIHGIGSYTGDFQFGGFGILPRSIFDCDVSAIPTQYLGSSGECQPKPVVTYNGMTLVEGVDYTLGYANNSSVTSNAQCYISGMGNYEEIRMVPFQIKASSGPYRITVTGGMAKDDGASTITQSKSGEIVNLVPDPAPAGKQFGYWLITPKTVQVDQYGGFVMPAGNVTAKAVYITVSQPTGGPMYRLYNQWTYEHFYTASVTERDNLMKAGWTYEDIGWWAPSSGDPVYRLYNPWAPGGDHHYTTSWNEYMTCINAGWRGEGVGWYSEPDKIEPIYREYNPYETAHNHNYTGNRSEHDYLISVGWRDEGIGWYGTAYG